MFLFLGRIKKYCITIFLFFPFISFGQYWEVGGFGGLSGYSGDLSESIYDLKEIHFAGGGLIRYNLTPYITLKANFYHGVVSGNDANARSDERKIRNLSFQSSLLDIGFQGEFNLRGYKSGHPQFNNSPYLFGGFSVFHFNPRALYLGKWYELQPLGTEGQGTTKYNDREKYALTEICIPLGFGWKYALNRYWNIGCEVGLRYTFTDYIDDVSSSYVESDILRATYGEDSEILGNRTGEVLSNRIPYTSADMRGDPTKQDSYFFTGLTFTYSILPNQCYRF